MTYFYHALERYFTFHWKKASTSFLSGRLKENVRILKAFHRSKYNRKKELEESVSSLKWPVAALYL